MSAAVTTATDGGMEFHPAASIFPQLACVELDDFVKDVKEHGLREPIWTLDGKILDGRNRYRACVKAGVTPMFREWTGTDPVAFVLSMNVHRRHLSVSQRAMVAAQVATLRDGQKKPGASIDAPSQAEAAALLKVSRPSVQRARVVLREATPEDVAAVERGETTINRVLKKVRPPKTPLQVFLSKARRGRRAVHGEVDSALREVEVGASRLLRLKVSMLRTDRKAIESRVKAIMKALSAVLVKAAS